MLKNLRAYFNERAAIWDEIATEKDTTKLERMAKRLNIKPGATVLTWGREPASSSLVCSLLLE